MSYWKRLLTLFTALAMLASLVLPAAANGTEYSQITVGQTVTPDVNDEECLLKFVPEADGWYGFYSTGEDLDPRAELRGDSVDLYDDDGGTDWNFLIRAQLTAGETYYLQASWWDNDNESAFLALHVAPLTAAEAIVLDSQEISDFEGSNYWLDYEFLPALSIPEDVTLSSSDETVVSVDEFGNLDYLAPGTAVITVTSESGLTATCTVTVKGIDTISVGQVVEPDLDLSSCKLSFVPDSDGWYGFYSTGSGVDPQGYIYDAWYNRLANDYDSGGNNHFIAKAFMTAGETYYLEAGWWCYNEEDRSLALYVTPLTAAADAIVLDNQEISAYEGFNYWLYYKFLPALSIPEDVTFSSSNEAVASVNQDGEVKLLCGGTAEITVTTESGLTASCTVTVKGIEPISVGQVVRPELEAESCRLAFTPEIDGWYGFYSTGYGVDPQGYIYDAWYNQLASDYDSGGDSHFIAKAFMTAGETYYLEAGWWCYNEEDRSLALHVTPLTAAEAIVLSTEALTDYVGTSAWFNWEMQPLLSIPEDVTFSSSNEAVASVDSYGRIELLSPGTAVITVTSESGLTAELTVEAKTVRQIHCGDSVTLSAEEEFARFRFVPETTGGYCFYSTNAEGDPYGEILDERLDSIDTNYDDPDGWNFGVFVRLQAGQVYYLQAYTVGGSCTVHLQEATAPTSMIMSQEQYVGYPGDFFNLWATLLPELSYPEQIDMSSSDESVVAVLNYGEVKLVGAGTATITATSESGLTATCTVTVKGNETISVGQAVTPELEAESCRLAFTPEIDGWYGFYSTGEDLDPWAELRGDSVDLYDDDSGTDWNFLIRAQLTAGETYCLQASWGGKNNESAFLALHVTPLAAAEAIVLDNQEIIDFEGSNYGLGYEFLPALSIPENVTFSSSDETVASVDSYGGIKLLSPGTAVITATTENGLSASCTVTVKGMETISVGQVVTPDPDTENCQLAFNPDSNGWYGFYSTGSGVSAWGSIRDTEDNYLTGSYTYDETNNFIAKAYLIAGNTYYLKAFWNTDDAEIPALQIAPLGAAESITLSPNEISDYPGTSFWMTCHYQPFLSIPEEITFTSSDETVASISGDNDILLLATGTAVITATTENGLTATCMVTVKGIEPISVGQVVKPDVRDEECKLSFTPDSDGWYGFYSTGSGVDPYGDIYDAEDNWLDSDDDSGENNHFITKAYLTAGETYRLQARWWNYSSGSSSLALHVAPLSAAEAIVLEDQEISGFENTKHHLHYTLQPLLSIPEDVTFTSSNPTVARVNHNGEVQLLSAGTAEITLTTESGLTATCTVTVRGIETISVGQVVKPDVRDEECKLSFTPDSDGWYGFYSTGSGVDPRGYIYDAEDNELDYDDDSGENINFIAKAFMTAGETYYLEASWWNGDIEEGDFLALQIAPLTPAESIVMHPQEISAYEGSNDWLDYEFLPALSIPEDVTFSSSNEAVASVNQDGKVKLLCGGTAEITVTTESGLTASCSVTVQSAKEIQCGNAVKLDASGETVRFRFVPQTDGWYCFYCVDATWSSYGTIYDANRNTLDHQYGDGQTPNFSAHAFLEAGQTYYLDTSADGDTYTVQLVPAVEATDFALSHGDFTLGLFDWEYLDVTFSPFNAIPKTVTWESSDDSVVTVNAYGEVFARSVGTATITATAENGWTASCKVTVPAPETLVCDQEVTVEISDNNQVFAFTPDSDGWYGFYAIGDGRITGDLMDENGESLSWEDVSGNKTQFVLRQELKAGQTYILHLYAYEPQNEESYVVGVSRLKQPQQLELFTDRVSAYAQTEIYLGHLDLLPVPSFLPTRHWTSSDTSVATVNKYGQVKCLTPGTAVITVATEDGLSDSITVTVYERPAEAEQAGSCGDHLLFTVTDEVMTVTGHGDMYNHPGFPSHSQAILSEGVTSIGNLAFYYGSVQRITVAATVTKIGHLAFYRSDLQELRFLGSAPELAEDSFDRVTATVYYPAGDPSWSQEVRQNYGGQITWIAYTPGEDTGKTLSGTVTTFSDADATLELLQGEDMMVTMIVTGKTNRYEMCNLLPGTYTLKVSEEGHVTRTYTVTVADTAVTLDVKLCIPGDITGDGKVNVADTSKVYSHVRETARITDEYILACADITGDGRINVADTSKIYAKARK